MNTYSDYANDAGLGFGISTDDDSDPTLRRASDVGGSEIIFRCDDDTLAIIESEIASDDQCGPEDDDSDGSDAGLVAFWRHVERVIEENKQDMMEMTCADGSTCTVELRFGRTEARYYYDTALFGTMADDEWPTDGQIFDLDGNTYRCGDWDLVDGVASATVELVATKQTASAEND